MMRMTMNRDVVLRRQRRLREHAERHESETQVQDSGRRDRIEQLARAVSVSVPSMQWMRATEVRVELVPNTFHETAQKARPRPVTPGQEEAAQLQRYGGGQQDRGFNFHVILDIWRYM